MTVYGGGRRVEAPYDNGIIYIQCHTVGADSALYTVGADSATIRRRPGGGDGHVRCGVVGRGRREPGLGPGPLGTMLELSWNGHGVMHTAFLL